MQSIAPLSRRRCGTVADGELFAPGGVTITDSALALLARAEVAPATLVHRHCTGDWIGMLPRDRRHNLEALARGGRIFSSFRISQDRQVWVITEADRCCTTILLPGEY